MMTSSSPREPWDDRRLEAAFAARGSRTRTPTELVGEVVARVRAEDPPMRVWRRWLPAASVVVLAIGIVAGGIALSGDVRGQGLFRAGPTADLKTLDNGAFAFDYPASWLGYDASAAGSGVSSIAVLGTQPVERRCGTERHVDLNCVYEQRLEAGQVRLFVLGGAYRGQTIEDRAPIENGTTSRVRVGGMPAIVDEFDPRPDSFYGEDQLVQWEIARPGTGGTNVIRLEAMVKEPGVAEARRQLDALVASFRFANSPEPWASPTAEPTPTEAAPRLSELPVMTVEELIAAAEAPSSREVIVRGWIVRSSDVVDCSSVLTHPLVPGCGEFGLSLLDDSGPVELGTGPPQEPHLLPMLRHDAHADVEIPYGRAVEVQVIGHLLDHRWTTCPEAAKAECKARFVIDRIVPAGRPLGDDLPVPWASPPDRPVGDQSQAIDALTAVVGGVTVVSIGGADADTVRSIEPLVQDINNEEGAWVIRALVGGDTMAVARTFLVGHIGSWTVFEVTETGVVDLLEQPSEEPTDVLGLPVISVGEAIAIRDAGRDDQEIAVRGWLPPWVPVRCVGPRPPVTSPIEPSCLTMFEVLMADKEQLATRTPDGLSAHGPAGRAISIYLNEIDQSWRPLLSTLGQASPAEIVAIGHFDDRRSGWCDPTRIDACRDRFVVDRVEWADGVTQGTSLTIHADDRIDVLPGVEAIVTSAAAESRILSASIWPGSAISHVEPSLREERPGITDQKAIWVVRVLERGEAITYLVVDGTDRIYRVETDGQTVLVGGRPPEDPERTWPPNGVMDVPMPEGPTGLVAKAGVVDRSGLLVEARAAREGDPRTPNGDPQAGEMSIVQAAPDTIIVYWDGTLCDDRFVMTVYGVRAGELPDRLELRGEKADSCRLALAHRGIVLRFSQPVDAAAMNGWDRVGTPFETFPPVDSTVIFLPKAGGFDLPKARAALVDLSGRIKVVGLPQANEPRPDDGRDGPGALLPDPSVARRYHLIWNGGICTRDIVITIDATLSNVVVSNPVPGNCDTIANEYRLVLDIEGRLDPPAVEVDYAETSAGAS